MSRITIEPSAERVRVEKDGVLLAESERALILHEKDHEDRYYLPKDDVVAPIEDSDHHSFCPFKGTASYYNVGGHENIAWYYPEPKDGVEEIKDQVAFWKADISVG